MRRTFTIYPLLAFLLILLLPAKLYGICGTPENLQVAVSGSEVTFSWSGTGDADIHAVMLWDKNTQQNTKAYTSVGTSFTASNIPTGIYRWRVVALCNTRNSLIDNSDWIWGDDFDFEGNCPQISPVSAGHDQQSVIGTSTILSASLPSGVQGITGRWQILMGEGGILGDEYSGSSTFSGIAGNVYQLRWTVFNDCGNFAYDDVIVSFEKENHLNPNLTYGSISDIEGNTYATIQIGNQTWMAENLRTTKYNDGITIPNVTDNTAWAALTTGAWSYYNHDASKNYPYGKLYNWYAVNTDKLCPSGWHIPSDAEWIVLTNFLGSNGGGKMKSVIEWSDPNLGSTNASGFSGLPGGFRQETGPFANAKNYGYWWSTEALRIYSRYYYLSYNNGVNSVGENNNIKTAGFSCRCVKDCPLPSGTTAGYDLSIFGTSTALSATVPSSGNTGLWTIVNGTGGSFGNVSSATSTFTGISGRTYTLRWTVTNECRSSSYGDVIVNFCSLANAGSDQTNVYSIGTTLAALTPSHGTGLWTIVSGTGGIIGNPSNPSSFFTGEGGNTYTLRWTVSNVCGSSFDEMTVSFAVNYLNPNLTYGTVIDIDGNTYPTIQIGNQKWMAENLKTTKYNDGTVIPNVTNNTSWAALATGGWSYYNNDTTKNYPYGKLYNWYAGNTGKLCPSGWRIPTRTDLDILSDYLGGAGGKMKSVNGWNSPNTGATNESGFSGLPGGTRDAGGSFTGMGNIGYWWTTTDLDGTNSWLRTLAYDNISFNNNGLNKLRGLSCRCLRDCPPPSNADAGSDQILVATNTILSAVVPAYGSGVWSVISGSGGNIVDPSSVNSAFSGIAGSTYLLRWTVSNECGDSVSDSVKIIFHTSPYLNPNLTYGIVTDIDDNIYATIKIGNLIWMAENLKVTRYNDAISIPNVTNHSVWDTLSSGAWKYYNENESYNDLSGKLYNWNAVKTDKLCPQGWRIPSNSEWRELIAFLGNDGSKMRTVIRWAANSTNESGFSAYPGGWFYGSSWGFERIDHAGAWWDSSKDIRGYSLLSSSYVQMVSTTVNVGIACRCVKD